MTVPDTTAAPLLLPRPLDSDPVAGGADAIRDLADRTHELLAALTPQQARCTGALTLGAIQDVPGCTLTLTPPTGITAAVVRWVADMQQAGAGDLAAVDLWVDGAVAGGGPGAIKQGVGRATVAQTLKVTGLSVAAHTFKLRATGVVGGGTLNALHTVLEVSWAVGG